METEDYLVDLLVQSRFHFFFVLLILLLVTLNVASDQAPDLDAVHLHGFVALANLKIRALSANDNNALLQN